MSDLERILKLASHGTADARSQAPAERELKDVPVVEEPTTTREAVGEFAEPIYDLIDMHFEGDCQPVFDDLVRFLSGDQIKEFVDDFRRHHELPMGDEETEESVEPTEEAPVEELPEAKAKPDFADIDGDGDEKETMKKAAKDKEVKETTEEAAEETTEELEEVEVAEDDKEELEESPTMDTTQLITLLKNAGLSEEKIKTKLDEWANTPAGAAEEEATSHGEPYENFAQSVNLSLKRYLDAESMKVGIKEHTVKDIAEAYKKFKGVPVAEANDNEAEGLPDPVKARDEIVLDPDMDPVKARDEIVLSPDTDSSEYDDAEISNPEDHVTIADIQGFLKIQDLVGSNVPGTPIVPKKREPVNVKVIDGPVADEPLPPQLRKPIDPLELKAKVQF